MEIKLTHKTALVCGATAGIGKECALQMALAGASVLLLARDEAKLKKTLGELSKTGDTQQHSYIVADLSKHNLLLNALENQLGKNKTIHILVNNTGGPPPGAIIEAGTDDFLKTFEQHLICNQILTQYVIGGMKDAGFGRIINIISTSVKQPIPNLGVSNTIRAAVASWAKTLSYEVGSYGITVNNVLPGFTKTGRLDSLIEKMASQRNVSIDVIIKELADGIPAKRFAEPAETAFAVMFLASDYSGYINGINLPVDGGRLSCL